MGNGVIETFYNRRRLRKHKIFGYLTPAETRQRRVCQTSGVTRVVEGYWRAAESRPSKVMSKAF
ncbi:hypothetical protein, partial [Streptomyces sp. NPDC018352]|uniref:hypothetical protein n=1 Tax=Streptomyces sp. NPDC018352 TaxID=3157194 RepID=UPI0034072E2E